MWYMWYVYFLEWNFMVFCRAQSLSLVNLGSDGFNSDKVRLAFVHDLSIFWIKFILHFATDFADLNNLISYFTVSCTGHILRTKLPEPDHLFPSTFKVELGGFSRIIFGVKVETVKLLGGRWFLQPWAAYMSAQIIQMMAFNSDHGYLDTLDNPLGPP